LEGTVRRLFPVRAQRGALFISIFVAITYAEVMTYPTILDAKEWKVSDIAAKTGLVLPQAARVVGVRGEAGIDELVQLKLETNSIGLEQFLTANRLDRTAFEEIQRTLLLPDAEWWDPSRATTLPTAQIRKPGGPTLNIGYAPKPSGVVELYIMWFTT
jgi:hypothetical protein